MFGFTKETKRIITKKRKVQSDPNDPDSVEFIDDKIEVIDKTKVSSWQEIDGVSKIDDLFY